MIECFYRLSTADEKLLNYTYAWARLVIDQLTILPSVSNSSPEALDINTLVFGIVYFFLLKSMPLQSNTDNINTEKSWATLTTMTMNVFETNRRLGILM